MGAHALAAVSDLRRSLRQALRVGGPLQVLTLVMVLPRKTPV